MQEPGFMEVVAAICKKDTRYHPEAYCFIRDALDFTIKKLKKPAKGTAKHVSGKELSDGIRQFALKEYGPMTQTVLKAWGLNRTDDFGEIVFSLVETGRLGKTDSDKKEDFANGYDFGEAFEAPFVPASRRGPVAGQPKRKAKRTPRRPPTTKQE